MAFMKVPTNRGFSILNTDTIVLVRADILEEGKETIISLTGGNIERVTMSLDAFWDHLNHGMLARIDTIKPLPVY